jgi:lysophospholipase L1-like esterase
MSRLANRATLLNPSRTVVKRFTHAITGSGGTGGSFNTTTHDYNGRHLIKLPVTPTRYRFRIRNWSRRGGTFPTGTLQGVGIWMGSPAMPSQPNRWNGVASAAMTPVQTTFSLVDSTEFVTGWITNVAGTPTGLLAGVTSLMSLGLTNVGGAGAVSVTGDFLGGVARLNAGAVGAGVPDAAAFTGNVQTAYFDIRMDVEYVTTLRADGRPTVPVVLFIGDSITEGHPPTASAFSYWRHESWAGQAAIRNQFCAVNTGIAGTTTSQWAAATTSSHNYFVGFDLATTVPDVAVISIGINDDAAATSAATQQANIETIIDTCRNVLGIPRVFLATKIPSNFASPITVTGGATTSGSKDISFTAATGIHGEMPITGTGIPASTLLDAVTSPTTATMKTAATATNTGLTFTIGSAGYLTTAAKEVSRQAVNTWIRTNPHLVDGFIDLDHAIYDPTMIANGRGNLISVPPHPNWGGYGVMSSVVPKF